MMLGIEAQQATYQTLYLGPQRQAFGTRCEAVGGRFFNCRWPIRSCPMKCEPSLAVVYFSVITLLIPTGTQAQPARQNQPQPAQGQAQPKTQAPRQTAPATRSTDAIQIGRASCR